MLNVFDEKLFMLSFVFSFNQKAIEASSIADIVILYQITIIILMIMMYNHYLKKLLRFHNMSHALKNVYICTYHTLQKENKKNMHNYDKLCTRQSIKANKCRYLF